ncbi:hypothetical protein QR680_006763 [Steinernema hermaphroditum]|uniref:Uncharacterized protein n=1 Tax=Steinernema hermaphroditum TaxID=289476 RepID=A0AA39HYN0_9BILA|nr:hypothetical protein QR680_006763 [Steinernema hermaphroditum]
MECDCLPPPPLFDVPPPIDPSAIWELLSDEPRSALDKLHAQSCDYNPLLKLVTGDAFPPSAFTYLALAVVVVLLLTASALGVVLRCRRSAPSPKKTLSKGDSAARGHGGATDWSYNSMKLPHAISAIQMYGGSHGSPAQPLRPVFPSLPPNARYPSAASATLRVHSDGCYSTASRHYEEIPGNFHIDDSETLFEDVSSDSYYADGNPCRRPPPSCRPPPPPLADTTSPISSLSFDHSGSTSTIDRELAKIQGSPSPRRSDDGAQGRESGYGTGPSRLWHNSPKLQKRDRDRSVPLTVFAHHTPQHSSMTYV